MQITKGISSVRIVHFGAKSSPLAGEGTSKVCNRFFFLAALETVKILEHSALGMFWAYFVLIVIFSIFGFWPQCATNLPILSGIVPVEHSSKVMAWQSGFENLGKASAELLGPSDPKTIHGCHPSPLDMEL